MKIYLDDNFADPLLAGLLQKAGHVVVLPKEVGLVGASDPRHLEHAVTQELVVMTKDGRDFEELDNLIRACGGSHPGMLVVRFDNDLSRDMKSKHIIAALGKLERSGFVMIDQVVILNHWR